MPNDHSVDAFAVSVTGGTEQFFVRVPALVAPRTNRLIRLVRVHQYMHVQALGAAADSDFAGLAMLMVKPEEHGTAALAAQVGSDTLFNAQGAGQMMRNRSSIVDIFRFIQRVNRESAVGIQFFDVGMDRTEEYDLEVPALFMHYGFDYQVTTNATECFTRVEYRYEHASVKKLAALHLQWGLDASDLDRENL